MSTYGLSPFTAAFSLAVALPGPGVGVSVARGLARGMAGAYAFECALRRLNCGTGAVMAGAAVLVAVR